MSNDKDSILIEDSPGDYIQAIYDKHELKHFKDENVLAYTYFIYEVQKALGIKPAAWDKIFDGEYHDEVHT